LNPQASPARTSITVLFCHGSRSADWRTPFEQLANDYRQRFGQQVRLAFLELMTPDLTQVLAEEVEGGTSSVRIVPLFLAPGAHTSRDLPALVDEARRRWPQLQISIEPTLLESPALRQALVAALGA
jgi:sirohydrochlorin cobaltochelatase